MLDLKLIYRGFNVEFAEVWKRLVATDHELELAAASSKRHKY